MSNEPEETIQPQSEDDEQTYYEVSLENDDGTLTKVMEFERLGTFQLTPSDQKDSVQLTIPLRIQTFVPIQLNQSLSLVLNREKVRQMAEMLGLIDS